MVFSTGVTRTGGRTYEYRKAIVAGTLFDLMDAVADGSLTLDWERRTI